MNTSLLTSMIGLGLVTASSGVIVFTDNFESPNANTSYTLANTSGLVDTAKWVRGIAGFNATRNGIVGEDRVGESFVDPVGSQAYGFRYSSNTGVTTAFGQVGTLTAGQTITVTFDVIRDNFSSNNYANYNAYLVLFNGASTRDATQIFSNNTVAILDSAVGTATSNAVWNTISFSYTVGQAVIDNNGATAGVSTTYLSGLEGYDIALRFAGQGLGAIVDNVSIDITSIPEPAVTTLGAFGGLLLLHRRRT